MKRQLSLLTTASTLAMVLALSLAVAFAQDEVTMTLSPVGGSGVSGTATLTSAGNQTRLTLSASGLAPGSSNTADMHLGTCASVGAEVFVLATFTAAANGTGSMTATVNATLGSVQDGNHLVAIHGPSGVMVACGNIPKAAAAVATTTTATATVAAVTTTATTAAALPRAGDLPLPAIPTGLLGALALSIGIYLRRR